MAPYCQHLSIVNGTLEFDFARSSSSNGSRVSEAVSVGVCQHCGHIDLHAKLPAVLCEWLKAEEMRAMGSSFRVVSEHQGCWRHRSAGVHPAVATASRRRI